MRDGPFAGWAEGDRGLTYSPAASGLFISSQPEKKKESVSERDRDRETSRHRNEAPATVISSNDGDTDQTCMFRREVLLRSSRFLKSR